MNKNKYFLNDWKNKSKQDILDDFCEKQDHNIIFASYVYQDYQGDAFVLVEKDGKLYEVNAGHCSCYGLENQFNLEETSIAALVKYLTSDIYGLDFWTGRNLYRNELIDFIREWTDKIKGILK
ncbi:MAG: hypothetical protein QXW48_04500 [Thermoplasmata archaeon]